MKLPLLVLLSLPLGILPARGHEGHVHADEPKVAAIAAAPRFAARTEVFELVGVLAGGEFHLYLDRADSNAPVDAAEIEVESGAFTARAERSAPGTYRLKAGPLAAAGRHALTVSVAAGEDADLLTATFDNAPAAAGAAADAHDHREPWQWAAGGVALVLLAAAAFAMRLRRRRK